MRRLGQNDKRLVKISRRHRILAVVDSLCLSFQCKTKTEMKSVEARKNAIASTRFSHSYSRRQAKVARGEMLSQRSSIHSLEFLPPGIDDATSVPLVQ